MYDPKLDEFKWFYGKIKDCKEPEELFGNLPGTAAETEKVLNSIYRGFVKKYGPDQCFSDSNEVQLYANEIMIKLGDLRAKGLKKIKAGAFGNGATLKPEPIFTIDVGGRIFKIMEQAATGDVAAIYRAQYEEDGKILEACVKVALEAKDNDLLEKEADILTKLLELDAADKKDRRILQSLPRYAGRFKTTDEQQAVIMQWIDGYDLVSLREDMPAYEQGIPQQHVFWIFLRLLNALGHYHSNEIIHGNLTPQHIIVRPQSHNAYPVDLTGAIVGKDPARKFVFRTDTYSSPDVGNKETPMPHHDLYSVGKCMIFALGGNVNTGEIIQDIDPRLEDFILKLAGFRDVRYPQDEYVLDAWGAYHKLEEIRYEATGKIHEFLPLVIG
jgi:serine/threonine protein kinase